MYIKSVIYFCDIFLFAQTWKSITTALTPYYWFAGHDMWLIKGHVKYRHFRTNYELQIVKKIHLSFINRNVLRIPSLKTTNDKILSGFYCYRYKKMTRALAWEQSIYKKNGKLSKLLSASTIT